ncbi:NAD-dependent epimerase/dehydratase family protein [Glacieibacterium frigidum]|uniref:NAD-dependent epimerase/dehydratase family protein n=1 Tax=Glacieibacterium frigidum TaxID=2593303 RepID=A0A552UGC9_9SPHN|nr:NAD-dependent epimerase/dehydratase family protein [Glacieibacterium frigidum]TRW17282.1 NAD-dependent epimerase/dehydratase family protein [Glacieibacterium frigidum]
MTTTAPATRRVPAGGGPRAVLVTGGAGFLGGALCARLLEEGWRVTALDDLSSGHAENVPAGCDFIHADVREPITGRYDVILNLASPAAPADYMRDAVRTVMTNVTGMAQVLDAARRDGARVVQASTSEIYGDPDDALQSEAYVGRTSPVGPRAAYVEGKRAAEALCAAYARQHGVDVTIARIFNVYGPGTNPADGRVIPQFIGAALRGEPLVVNGDGSRTRSFCFVDDFTAAFAALIDAPVGLGPINIGNSEEVSIGELAQLIVELTGSRSEIRLAPPIPDEPRQRRPDIALAQRVLGWRPEVDLAKGLRLTIDAFRGVSSE